VLTIWFARALRSVTSDGPFLVTLPWAPSLGLSLSFYLDGLSLLFALLIAGVGTLIAIYAAAYMRSSPAAGRFHATLFAFMGAMLGVVLSDNLFTLFVFWELTGFTSFLLIGFQQERSEARSAAVQALIVTGGGGIALLAGSMLLGQAMGTVSLSAMLTGGARVPPGDLYTAIVILVLLAAFTKSAQVPFHFWLPNAMAAPTPVSAYLHSATMVKAGVYLVARMTPILGGTTLWTMIIVVAGAATMAAGAWRAVQETDLKTILAYSTVSALGALMLLLGLGTDQAVTAALIYLVAHACYKGALFLVAGAIEHETGTRDVTELAGLRRAMPWTSGAAVLAAGSMMGLPLFLGFLGKEALYDAIQQQDRWPVAILAIAVGENVLLGVAALTAGVSPFFGRAVAALTAHEAPRGLWIPALALAVTGLLTGIVPALVEVPLSLAATAVLGETTLVSLAIWHGVTPTLMLSVFTLAAVAAAYRFRGHLRRLWPGSLRTERLYTGTLAGLDAISRVVAPSLQSASLRTYVMTLVLVGGSVIGTAVVAGGGRQGFAVTTDVQVHELLVAALIVGGALSAASATSSMKAVLSLGVVGYGVALMFLSFGAPDLAMTQFSVETLTVVIFVLVFRHLPKFYALSPAVIRARDALIAAAVGATIAALVLFVGTSGTESRLADYFVETGPGLAHGRNIVNVILVDFRAFDTLGEITVLVTAAIGVHALMRIGSREDRRS